MNQLFWDLWTDDHVANLAKWSRLPYPSIPKGEFPWTRASTANPEFAQVRDDLLLYYRGTGDPEERDQIGAAVVREVSRDGIRLDHWTEDPIIPYGGPGEFDADVLDPRVIQFRGEVFLYYSALGADEDSIGLATSPDGRSFTKQGKVMAGRAPAPVVRDGKVWLLNQVLEGTGYACSLYVSTNGREFDLAHPQPVFHPEKGSWDGLSVVTAAVYQDGDTTYMVYGGSADTVDEPAYFGLARSTDLINWERHPGNPIFGAGARGTPDGGCIWFPTLHENETEFVMLYEGSRGTPRWDLDCNICFATVNKS